MISCNVFYCSLKCINSRNVVISKQFLPFPLVYAFFRQVCPQSHLAKSLLLNAAFSTWRFSNVLAQTLLMSEYHSNKTNRYRWWNQHRVLAINREYTGALLEISIKQINRFPAWNCSTISERSIKQQASIKQNQSFPWTKLLHDLRAINKTTSNLHRICMKCRIWSAWRGTVTSVSHRRASKGQSWKRWQKQYNRMSQSNQSGSWTKYEDLGTVHTSCFCSTQARQKHDKSTMSESKFWIRFGRAIKFVTRLDTTWTIKFDCGLHHIWLPKKCIMASCIRTYILYTNIHSWLNLPIGVFQEQ